MVRGLGRDDRGDGAPQCNTARALIYRSDTQYGKVGSTLAWNGRGSALIALALAQLPRGQQSDRDGILGFLDNPAVADVS